MLSRFLLVTFVCVSLVYAQTSSPRRDASAIAFLDAAAVPQATSISATTTVVVTGTTTTADGNSFSFTWTTKGNQFKYENTGTDGTVTSFLSNGGQPAISSTATGFPTHMGSHLARIAPMHLPFFVLSSRLSDTRFAFEDLGLVSWNGNSVREIRCYDATSDYTRAITQEDWYFDPISGYPVKVEFNSPPSEDALSHSIQRYEFTKYGQFNGITIPLTWSGYIDGKLIGTTTVTNLDISTSAPDSLFLKGGN